VLILVIIWVSAGLLAATDIFPVLFVLCPIWKLKMRIQAKLKIVGPYFFSALNASLAILTGYWSHIAFVNADFSWNWAYLVLFMTLRITVAHLAATILLIAHPPLEDMYRNQRGSFQRPGSWWTGFHHFKVNILCVSCVREWR
jgi:hypothetical protein